MSFDESISREPASVSDHRFEDLRLIEPLVRAVRGEGYLRPTPIQQRAIPHVLAGRDLLACAQTGTGKTAAFALPILQRLATTAAASPSGIRVLVLSPTRELAAQIGQSFATYGAHTGISHTVVFGGVGQDAQVRALRSGKTLLVATPGRLLDLMGQGLVRLRDVGILVLDEADRMLDMGFLPDVRRIIAAVPRQRQTLLFSATMPRDIEALAANILIDPIRVEVTPVATTAERIAQSVHFVGREAKRPLLERLLADPAATRTLVFTRTKHGANRVAAQLERAGIRAAAIHGNKSQGARERALATFKAGTTRVLVATDIAARGIDVDGVSHVVNYDLPDVAESYVHRIGRTARAGAEGIAVSFCDPEERRLLRDIERLIRMPIPVVGDDPRSASEPVVPAETGPARGGAAGGARFGGGARRSFRSRRRRY
jgi:ATP-dependent RNA helicase RhlE